MIQHTEETQAPHATSAMAEHTSARYFSCFLILPLLALIFPVIAERVEPLKSLSASYFCHLLDYDYEMANTNADIVLFGDSTALFGVDTPLLSKELGVKVVNIPGTVGSLPITGDQPLRRYLATNHAPRLIIFYLAPANLDFMSVQNGQSYASDEQVLRHGTWADIFSMIRHRPKDLLRFPYRFYSSPTKLTDPTDPKQYLPVSINQGYSPNRNVRLLPTDCELHEYLRTQSGTASVQRLVRDFTSPQTKTLIYLAPIPACKYAEQVVAMRYPNIDILPPAILPREDFSNDTWDVHLRARSAGKSTDLLAKAIKKLLTG